MISVQFFLDGEDQLIREMAARDGRRPLGGLVRALALEGARARQAAMVANGAGK